MSDHIVLTGIHGFGYHGLFEHERKDGQDFYVAVSYTHLTLPTNREV